MFLFVAELRAKFDLEQLRIEFGELVESGTMQQRKNEVEKPKKKKPRESVDPPAPPRRSSRDKPQVNYFAESDPEYFPSDDEDRRPRKSRPRKNVSSGGRRTRRAESPPPDRGGKRRRQQELPESELDHCGDEMGEKVCFEQGLTPTCQ